MVVIKEFLQLRQDRKMIPVMIVGPLVQLLALGFAANLDVNLVPMLLVDQDRTRRQPRLVERFTGSGYFTLVGSEPTVETVEPWLVDGRAQVALVVPAGFGADVQRGPPGAPADDRRRLRLQLGRGGPGLRLAPGGRRWARSWCSARCGRSPGLAPAWLRRDPAGSSWCRASGTTPTCKSRWFYVPAVLAMVLMLVTMMLPSMAVVREKEIGTLEQIIVTPLRPWQLILGKLVPFAIIGLVDMLLVTGLARLVFGVPLRGSLVPCWC